MYLMKGRDRNKPCNCDSGKKRKNCHPDLDDFFRAPILKPTDGPEVLENAINRYIDKKRNDRQRNIREGLQIIA